MAYNLLFEIREGQNISPDELSDWFNSRDGYTVDFNIATFVSEETGFTFSFQIADERTDNTVCTFSVDTPTPEVIVHEAEREVGALAKQFDLYVWDQQLQESDSVPRPHSRERMLHDFAAFNRSTYIIEFVYYGVTPLSVSREVWNRVWEWNTNIKSLKSNDDESLFVPKIMLIQMDEQVATAIALPAPLDALIPEVDYIITAMSGPIAFEHVKPSLVKIEQKQQPVPYWNLSPVPKAFAIAFNGATKANGKLSMPAAQDVMTKDIIEEIPAEMKQVTKEVELMGRAGVAYNTAQFKESLDLCNQVKGEYASMALMLAGVAKGELAMYDESFHDLAEYLKIDGENEMVWNVYGYFLCSVNRKTEGEKAYAKAIEILNSKLQWQSENHDLWSRKAYGLLGLNRAQEALLAARRGMDLNDSDALLIQHLGRAHLYLDQHQEAKMWLEKSVALDENNPYARFYLSKVLTHLGDHENAQQHADYVKKVSPHLSKML